MLRVMTRELVALIPPLVSFLVRYEPVAETRELALGHSKCGNTLLVTFFLSLKIRSFLERPLALIAFMEPSSDCFCCAMHRSAMLSKTIVES
jgi:hypothetical protein